MIEKLRHELVALFGRGLVQQAEITDVADLDITADQMDAVHHAADAILKHPGQPSRQRELVDDLDEQTTLLLCMWLMDTDFAGRIYAAVA